MTIVKKLTSACVALFVVIGGWNLEASIVSTTGPVLIISAPASVLPGASVSTTDAQVFSERQNLTLTSALPVDAISPGTYPAVGPGGKIPTGTDVNSYFVLFDSGGASVAYPTVMLTFSTQILGVIFSDSTLNGSDAILGNSSTKYPTGVSARGQDPGTGDSTTISGSGLTVTLTDGTSLPGDDIRIITAAQSASSVPEAEPWSLLSTGVTVLAVLRRRANPGHNR